MSPADRRPAWPFSCGKGSGSQYGEDWPWSGENETAPGTIPGDSRFARCVREAMRQLPEEHRIVLVLRHDQGLSSEAIAQALDLNVGTVRSRLHYALTKLRAALQRRVLWEG